MTVLSGKLVTVLGVENTTICTISGSLQAQNTYYCESNPLGKK